MVASVLLLLLLMLAAPDDVGAGGSWRGASQWRHSGP